MVGGFVAAMVIGGASFLALGLADQFLWGILVFILLAIAGAATFLWAAVKRCDPKRVAADYLAERGRT